LADRDNDFDRGERSERGRSGDRSSEGPGDRRSSDRYSRDRGPRGRRDRRFGPRRSRVCRLCANDVKTIDYKDADMLKQYISPSGRIQGRRRSGMCAKHQRILARAIKRARHIALLPYTAAHSERSL